MTAHNLPYWRLDNIYPLIGLLIGIGANIVTITWWGAQLSVNQKTIVDNQIEIKNDLKDWKKQAEFRIGTTEVRIAQAETFHEELKRVLHLK